MRRRVRGPGAGPALLRAAHAEPTLAVTTIAVVLAVAAGRGAWGAVPVGAAVLAGQLSIGWLNDAVDARRDVAAGRSDKPVAAGVLDVALVRRCAVGAGLACVPLSLLSGWAAGVVHLVAVASGWAYDLGIKSTAGSVLPYLVSFGLLPAFVVLSRPALGPGAGAAPGVPPWWLVVAGALLGGGAHFANVLPDLADDAATGVRGLPHRLGAAGSTAATVLLLLSASLVLALGPRGHGVLLAAGPPVLCAVVLLAGWWLGRRGRAGALFRAVIVVALVDVLLLVVTIR